MTDYNYPTIDLLNGKVSDYRMVSFRSILDSCEFRDSDMELPMVLGRNVSNEVFMADLSKLPHLLMAGATGIGKSVALSTIITSLLYKKHPSQLKLVLFDPKNCEFGAYRNLEHHFLAKSPGDNDPIVTDVDKALDTLVSLCIEMNNRFNNLMLANVRNVKEYNKKFLEDFLKPEEGHSYMPYIVVVIDEFSDLIATGGKEIENDIIRLAQKSHCVGIHLIISTQRTNFITGSIKANFPGRIAFKTLTNADSRVIIDRPDAEFLTGCGDMLFSKGGNLDSVQGAFINPSETERLCEYICQQPAPKEHYLL